MEDHIIQRLTSVFPDSAAFIIAKAPGRINLIGEHTDYNKGLALPASVDKYMYVALRPTTEDHILVHALDMNASKKVSLDKLELTGTLWLDYLIGLLIEFKNLGAELKAFECAISSTIPIGAGVSSSAALDCALLTALNSFYNTQLTTWEMLHMSNRSNNNFLGIKSGILDQFASLFGQENHLLFLDCDNLEHKAIPVSKSNYTWLLINTCVKHSHLSSGYNDRVKECQSALRSIQKIYPSMSHLSEVRSITQFENVEFENLACQQRAEYVVEENSRVRSFIQALEQDNFEECGKLLYASHAGLSKKYEVSCAELDFLVDIFRDDDSVLGSRMMGGGFGGCTLNLVHKDALDIIQSKASRAYFDRFGINAEFISVQIGEGAKLMTGL